MVKICENCNSEIEDDINFCPNCGFKFNNNDGICPVCNSKNSQDAKFCTNCGYNFNEGKKDNFKSIMGNIVEGVKGTIGEERSEEYKQSIDKIQKNINNKYLGFKSNVAVDVLPVNLVETESFYYIQANVAGMEKDQISIETTDNTISLKVESNNVLCDIENYDENLSILIQNEFRNNNKERIFNLDESIINGEIEIKQENGVLLVTIPKKEISENFEEKKYSFENAEVKEKISNVSKNLRTKLSDEKEIQEGKAKDINEQIKIKSIIKEEIKSGKITENEAELRKEELINEFKSKRSELDDVLEYIDEIFESEEVQNKITEYHFKDSIVYKLKTDLKNEVKKDYITKEEVPKKVYEKIDSEYERLKEKGIAGYDFKCTLYEIRQGTFGQKEDVINGYCFVEEDKLVIKKISAWLKHDKGDKIIPFANVNAIDYDKAGGLQITSSIVIAISGVPPITLRHITQEDFELVHQAWLDYNNPSKNMDKFETPTISYSADELIKYADLYEKGLLTEEEFIAMKQKIINQ